MFSACTWFDDPLRQRLKDDCFEKAVLVAVNECLISGVSATKERVKAIVEKVVFQSSKLNAYLKDIGSFACLA